MMMMMDPFSLLVTDLMIGLSRSRIHPSSSSIIIIIIGSDLNYYVVVVLLARAHA